MRTRTLLAGLLLIAMLVAGSGCDKFSKPWGTGTSINTLAGYTLGAQKSSMDLSKFIVPMQNSLKNPDAQVTLNGQTFKTALILTFDRDGLTEIRILSEGISGDELRKIDSAALSEIRSTYAKALVKQQAGGSDITMQDAAGHSLKVTTRQATLPDNDGVFDYSITSTPPK